MKFISVINQKKVVFHLLLQKNIKKPFKYEGF